MGGCYPSLGSRSSNGERALATGDDAYEHQTKSHPGFICFLPVFLPWARVRFAPKTRRPAIQAETTGDRAAGVTMRLPIAITGIMMDRTMGKTRRVASRV